MEIEVKIMLTIFEEREFKKRIKPFIEHYLSQDENFSLLLFKVLANYMDKTTNNNLQYSQLDENSLKDPAKVADYIEDMLKYMASISAEENIINPTYTTGQLATYFGVTITTINNWIKEGRFIGVQRPEMNKRAQISANTLFVSRSGKLYPVSKVVNDYEVENAEMSKEEEEPVF